MMKNAVHFGAGNIGRGFLGQLYYETGYQTTFIDVAEPLIEALNARNEYPLRIVGDVDRTITIGEVRAIHGADTAAIAAAIAEADLASTAVGVNVMPHITPAIAAGIERRFSLDDAQPLNIIICENMIEAGPFMREKVREHLGKRFHDDLDQRVGFVEASIGRMVPIMTDEMKAEDPLVVFVEEYCELPVDAAAFKGPIPELKNLLAKDNFGAYVERKLFVHNAGHATTAYLGALRGHEYTWQAVEDAKLRPIIEEAMLESCRALTAKHGLDAGELAEHAADLVHRFANKALGDQVMRVARDTVRKLGPNDRLIGSIRQALEQGIEPRQLALAAAAAIHYDHPDDPTSGSVQEIRRTQGVEAVLREICDVDPASELGRTILAGVERLRAEGWLKNGD